MLCFSWDCKHSLVIFKLVYHIIMSLLWRGGDMLVYLSMLSFSAQFVSVRSLRLYVPVISIAFYHAGGQTQAVDPKLG